MTTTDHTGRVCANARGFGFAETTTGDCYFIPPALMKRLLTEDEITFSLEPGRQPGERQVGSLKSLRRTAHVLLGEVVALNGKAAFVGDEPCLVALDVPDLATVPPGAVVAVRVPAATEATRQVRAELVEVLGSRARAGFDADYALLKYGLTYRASPDAEAEANAADRNVLGRLGHGWRDLRSLPLVTIDGESTRDIDDAVAARALPDGFEVWVAIADVSAYVRPDSALEREARERCTSVYLPGRTVPMLPEALSSEQGSLLPDVARLALVCRLRVSDTGEIREARFERGVIVSRARLTYDDVHARMSRGVRLSPDPAVEASLDALQALYARLAVDRKRRGVLEFNETEARLGRGANGEPDIHWLRRNDAHRLIEEMMLLANRAAARRLLKGTPSGLYRHQAHPDPADWAELREWLAGIGLELPGAPSLKTLSTLLAATATRPDAAVIEARSRRIMHLAVYDERSPEHFSLGFEAYTHFTSPLRRYSDIVVHRLLLGERPRQKDLVLAADRCSRKARAAKAAERFVWDRIKRRTIARDVPQATLLDSEVIHANRRGLKVLLIDWQVAALVPDEALLAAGLQWDAAARTWRNGHTLEAGRRLGVRWTRLVEDKGSCDLWVALADHSGLR